MTTEGKRISITLERGKQNEGWQLDDGTYFITYRREPLDEQALTNIAELIGCFIENVEQLFEPGITGEEEAVQSEQAKARAVEKNSMIGWLGTPLH